MKVAIVDSYGPAKLHPRYTELLKHVTFHGYEPASVAGTPCHGHGSWCAWNFLAQLSNPCECLFIRIFDRDAAAIGGADEYINKALADFAPDYINNSWGGGGPWTPREIDGYLEAIGEATVVFAAGNERRGNTSNPQRQLVGRPQVVIVGAVDSKGVRAPFSSTSANGKDRYADCMMLGVGSKSLDGASGEVVTWDGTSSASPSLGGDLAARNLTWREADAYFRATVLADEDADGIPDGINKKYRDLIAGGGWHPDVGIGVVEIGRQKNLRRTGLHFSGTTIAGVAVPTRSQFLDFDPI